MTKVRSSAGEALSDVLHDGMTLAVGGFGLSGIPADLIDAVRASGGAGIPAFYTKTGVGTLIAEGKRLADFDGETYLQERAIIADVSLVHAYRADTEGNLVYRYTARNFNPVVATAGRVTIAEAEVIVERGEIDPHDVVTPGVFVQRLVQASNRVKHIEQRTVRPRPGGVPA